MSKSKKQSKKEETPVQEINRMQLMINHFFKLSLTSRRFVVELMRSDMMKALPEKREGKGQ